MSDDINSEDYKTVRREIAKWEKFRNGTPWPERGKILRADLYNFRNEKGVLLRLSLRSCPVTLDRLS